MAEIMNSSLQENLITVLCHDDVAGKLVAGLAEPELFEGEYRTIAERGIQYWQKHKRAPKAHTSDLVGDILDDPNNRKANTYRRILRNMLQLAEGMNTEYVVEQLRKFSRTQRMKDAILKSAERLNASQDAAIDEVEDILSELLRAREIGFDRGIDLLDVDRIINYLELHSSEFRTGIKPFDRRNIVPARSAVMLFLAPTGRGKTWFLCHVGKVALMLRKRVVHITLELDAEQTAQRYYQDLFSIPKHAGVVDTGRLRLREGKFYDYERSKVKPPYSFDDLSIRKRLKVEVKQHERRLRNLIIKQFPQRSLDMNGLRAYLDTLEAQGFIPDMVILDYIGITKTDVKNPRSTLGRAFEDFRAIMQERKIAGVTAHQVSKIGMEAEMVRSTHVAEDVSLIFTSDISLTYSCTDAEEKLGLARLFVAKARSEQDKFGVIITQSYKLGQFVLQSAELDRSYTDFMREQGIEDEEDDDEEAPRKRRNRSRD
jgi:translation initiation factor 2B subunit (eIF-2B alpha/beta/delta family)